jgi:VCBS repeat-containing protein
VQRAYLDAETKVVRLPLLDGPAPARLVINDTHFLFTADFKKSGPDLILTGDDGKKLVIANYFNFEKHPDLVSPDGAVISAELVERLAGPEAPGQYAQAGAPAGAVVIGRVEIVSVNATVQHANGVVDNLKNGDSLLKGDVVMTGDGEGCTLSLIDGTALNMGSNGRMVLAELTYDSQSTSNSALINLVKGSFVFVAGQVAHTGDMRVSTPVATMGIRGTTVGTYLDADVNGNVYELTATLLTDPGGSSGAYDLLDPVTGAVLHRVRSTATQVTLSYGANNQLSMQEASKSPAILQHEIAVAQILFPIFLANPNNVQVNQPATPQPPNNSLTPPQLLPQPPQETDANNFLHIITTAAKITQPSVDNATSATANFLVIASPTEVLNNTPLTLAVVSLIETDTAAFDHFTAATGAVLSTNPSPNAALTFGISGGAAGSSVLLGGITYDVSNTGAYGTLYVNSSTGAYVFVPNDAAINALTAITTETFIITVSDGTASAQQPLTVTLNGHNDTPTIVAGSTAASGSFSESAGVTGSVATEGASGSIAFADVDLGQVHTVSASAPTFAWSGGTLTAAQLAVLTAAAALTLTVTDSTSSSPGSVEWTYSIADKALDFLAKGETLTLTYMATVDDHNGGTVTQPITITITGTDDAPGITAATSNAFAELPGTNIATPDTVGGTISFTDVDLSDRPTVTAPFASYSYLAAGGTALTLTAAQQTALEATLAIVPTAGSTNNGSASWTYSVADKALDFLAKGETLTLTYMATVDDHNGGIVTQPITITITGADDAPVITSGPAAVVVSEEGLPNGVPDTLPAILDTTNSPTASGTITASDADGDPLTMTLVAPTLGAPSVPLTSDGVTIEWTLQDAGHTLIGKAGTTPIITATITNAGAYTVTLTGPIDHPVAGQEDDKTFTVPVAVSDGLITTPTTLSVTVEDDSPKAEPVEVSVVPTDSKTNVMLMLDLSGSMNNSSGLPGLTRLDVEKAAINELLDQYDNRGDVMVRIVEFSNSGAAIGNAWMSVADAKAAVAGLSASGNTNYDAALLTAMAAFADGTKLSGPGTQNVSYFLSDGDPTANSDWPQIPGAQLANGIQANEQAVWESFLTTNNMVSFALGIPNVATPSNLNPIAFDPAAGTQLADTPIIVTNLGQLANTLVFTLPPVTGSILAGAGGTTSNSFGADGGFVQSITVEGVTYTFNPAANGGAGGITTSGGGSFTYDATTKTLTVDTDTNVVGGELAMVMTTGAFTFQPPTGFSGETVGYVLVDHDGDTASSVINFSGTTLTPGQILPAGVAGDPINLGLPDTADHVGPVTMTIAGVPSGWTLSEGADNGDGTWTIQASNVSALAITSPDDQAGAMAFTVTMSWTNADSSSGFVRITDNVEVFAQGAPMFAFSGDDNLTGSIGRDLFVFAQPIGNDRIYNFNPSEDHVDLIGFPGFASFDSVKDHLTTDANGNAVIALADGQSILLDEVAAASLGASNFVFNQEPVTNNADIVTIGDGAALPLSGVVDNTGTIALDSTGNETQLKLIQNGITLQGGGRVILSDNGENVISGTIPNVTLINADNTISGAGQLGDGQMTLVNGGTIAATGTHALIIDTGPNVVVNSGTLEATGSGSLIINSEVANSGLIWANGGNITINGAVIGSGTALVSGAATLEFGSGSSADISFAADAVGTLILQDPADFAGTISGFSSHDQIDLMNISNSMASIYSITYSLSSDVTTLIITDGTNSDTINFIGNYTVNTAWHFSNDGHGGTLITDQPEDSGAATVKSSTTLEIVGAAEQNLSFANNHGNSGTLVLDHSASFTGQISGFAGDGTLSNADSIDLKDVDFAAAKETYSGGILTVTDDAHTANLHFDGDYVLGNFVLASDDHGGTLVIDPPAPLDLTARFEPDHSDTGVQEAHGLAQEQTFSGFPLATANVTLDQFHFGNMDLTGLNAHAGDLTPAISSFGSDHFQFAAMDIDGFHQTPIVQPLELDLHHTPLQEIVEAGAPGVHNVTPMASEVSPGASLLDVIHAIHAHTA